MSQRFDGKVVHISSSVIEPNGSNSHVLIVDVGDHAPCIKLNICDKLQAGRPV